MCFDLIETDQSNRFLLKDRKGFEGRHAGIPPCFHSIR